jgi:hypothetical protein
MMAVDIVTKEDLQHFRLQLLHELKEFVAHLKNETLKMPIEGYRTKQVKRILKCSNGKLQSLRITGKLRCKKIGGALYYVPEDIQKLLTNDSDKV